MITARVMDWIGLLFGVAILYVLVRPGSKAGELVEAVGALLTALVKRATDVAA
jgi:hypothetical protein